MLPVFLTLLKTPPGSPARVYSEQMTLTEPNNSAEKQNERKNCCPVSSRDRDGLGTEINPFNWLLCLRDQARTLAHPWVVMSR
jgi:hypothetical protein